MTHSFLKKLAHTLPAACMALTMAVGAHASAASYPDKTIRLVVPFSAGGQFDTVARLLAEPLGQELGQTIIVENIGGGGGTIGGARVAEAAPDGYTLLAYGGNFAIAQYLFKNLKFDPIKAFEPVSGVSLAPHAVLVNNDLPVKNMAELAAYAKANPGALNYASPGVGSSMHLVFEELKAHYGIDAVHVPYRGGSNALNDLAGGQVQAGIVAVGPALPFIESGKIRAIAVTGKQRAPSLPNVPTVAESGFDGYESGSWLAIVVPAGTPKTIVQTLNNAINKVAAQPRLKNALEQQSFTVIAGTPEELMQRTLSDDSRYGPIVQQLNLASDK